MKVCTKCGKGGEFYAHRGRGNNRSWCKECMKKYHRDRYKKKKEADNRE